ncbi:hypothetical protein CK224_04630 [Mesorhizobium sp. WSM3862]|nr:hypothetical protein CK224_04630 [Mesorhizobium sp. WSM3862]
MRQSKVISVLAFTNISRTFAGLEASTTKFNNALNKANQTARKQLGEKQFREINKKLSEGLTLGGFSVGSLGGVDT